MYDVQLLHLLKKFGNFLLFKFIKKFVFFLFFLNVIIYSKIHIEFMPRVINSLASLLRDTSPQVIKRVIQSCAAVYKNTLQWLCTLVDVSDGTEMSWNTLCIMKCEILDMIDHDNDGIRTNAIKFLEGVVILQTYPDDDSMKKDVAFSLEDIPLTLKIVRRRKLEDEAINIFESLLKFQAASHISSVNLIACTGTLCMIGKMRPTSFLHSVVDGLKHLNSNLPPTLTDSQISSVRKHLKMQLINIIKLPAAYEMQSLITTILLDLSATNQEISKVLPKFDKLELHRRAKRAAENAAAAVAAAAAATAADKQPPAKRMKLDKDGKFEKQQIKRQMEIDVDEVEEQIRKSNQLNEQFIIDNLKTKETVIDLVMANIGNLPNTVPLNFLKNYTPVINLSLSQQVQRIAQQLSEQMTEKRIGPGATVITKDPPMRLKVTLEEEKNIIMGMRKDISGSGLLSQSNLNDGNSTNFGNSINTNDDIIVNINDMDNDEHMDEDYIGDNDDETNELRKEEATKKLRETMERFKGEQSMIPRMKQKAKSLKLQEVTKPISRIAKEKFLLESVNRILRSERSSIVGGVATKRRKIVTILAATFTSSVRDNIIKFIMADIKNRLDLAFSWLYEEYSLLQGFTRHSYIKTEQKPDYAYNKLLNGLIAGIYVKYNNFSKFNYIIIYFVNRCH